MDRMSLLQLTIRSLKRVLLLLVCFGLILLAVLAYARFVEVHWLRVRNVRLSAPPTVKLIHISDIHFDGDSAYLERVVRRMNALEAEAICFTGDLVEESRFLPEALRILSRVNKPMYGIPGNHDFWARAPFETISKTFRMTGGEWFAESAALLPLERFKSRRILLMHNPGELAQADRYDLILAGHTHGGQLASFFRHILEVEVGRYDRGLFQTPSGPLYVNPGLGTYGFRARFLCRPEITVIAL